MRKIQALGWLVLAVLLCLAWFRAGRSSGQESSASLAPAISTDGAPSDFESRLGEQMRGFEEDVARISERLAAAPGNIGEGGTTSCRLWQTHHPDVVLQDILRALVFAPHSLTECDILYSGTVNPRNLPISDEDFELVRLFLASYREHLTAAANVRGLIQSEEISQLESRGLLLHLVPEEAALAEASAQAEKLLDQEYRGLVGADREYRRQWIMSRISAQGIPAGFVKRRRGESVSYARKSDLVRTHEFQKYVEFRGCELALMLLELSGRWGLLTADEVRERVEKVFSLV